MSDILAGLLGRAVESFERYEEEEALQRLLEAWRESRAERLALLIERLSGLLPSGLAPLIGPVDLPKMLEELVALARHKYRRGLLHALGDFRKWPADPRLTPPLLALAALPAAREDDLFLPLCELLMHVKDPRALGPLRAVHAGLPPDTYYARRLDIVIGLIAVQIVTTLGAEASARCAELEEAIARREERVARSAPLREALLARIAESPEDDSARLVLADHLLEQGDPLGELITLQCMPQPDEARIARLLELHRAKWEARLGPCVARGRTRFERGFPVAVRMSVEAGQRLPPPGLSWCTVREIDWDWTGYEAEADWLAHPHLRGVTVLRHVKAVIARRLGAHPLPVRRLELRGQLTRDGPDVFTTLASLPSLARVEVQEAEPQDVLLCAISPLARRLERFEASNMGAWSLVAAPAAEVPVEATLVSEARCEVLAEAIRVAEGFGTRALRIHSRRRPSPEAEALLAKASAAYARVEWRPGPAPSR